MAQVIVRLLLAVAALGADPQNVVVRGERDLSGFKAQQAIVFEEDRVVYSRNSNFLCEPEAQVVLGVFAAKYDRPARGERKLLEQVVARLGGDRPRGGSPHELKLYLNQTEVTADKPNDATVRRLLGQSCAQLSGQGLKAERAVRVSLDDPASPVKLRVEGLDGKSRGDVAIAEACRRQGTAWECDVAGFGKAFLAAGKRPVK
ncbi:MAG: hypothetical protein HY075_09315 [Deltaproteobacteria bacterium]|nr:hypothetical protein [Deltaproteobacteria bacterium]